MMRIHLSGCDRVEGVGEHEEDVPQGANTIPGRRHPVRPVLDDHRLHRRSSQEGPRLERQDALPI